MSKRKRESASWVVGAIVAFQMLVPHAALAESAAPQAGENSWIASLAITAGATFQDQQAAADSFLIEDPNPSPQPRSLVLRGPFEGDDFSVSPFVGASVELMSPALPIPTRPRVFVSAEILPTFASDRNIAVEGDPDCVRGPASDDVCATQEVGLRSRGYGEDAATGTGTKTTSHVDTKVFGANVGLAFPVQFGQRQLRIKPSFGWVRYEVEADGIVVNAACDPVGRCTDVTQTFGTFTFVNPGFVRQPEALTASASKAFNGIGPGLDIEMDTGRFGPIGSSIFIGARAYYILGDRTISFGTQEEFDDVFGMDTGVANFEVEVDPWTYRTHLGMRFQWLGGEG